MESIKINNRELKYKEVHYTDGESRTNFYEGFIEVTKYRLCNFFRKETKLEPNYIFFIFGTPSSGKESKRWWNNRVTYQLNKYDEIQERKEEVIRGEIV